MSSKSRLDSTLASDDDFHLNAECSVCVSYVGEEQSPVLVIDNFWHNPEKLVALAAQSGGFTQSPEDYYPGLRKTLDGSVKAVLEEELGLLLKQHLDNRPHRIELGFTAFSLTNVPPAKLSPMQCIPHFDSTDLSKFALVNYLFKEPLGGTSFYRHRKTGFETVSKSRAFEYQQALQLQASTEGMPAAEYIMGDTNLFERIHTVPAWFNRAVLYPCNLLHSGDIPNVAGLSDDPKTGRLTLNAELKILQEQA
ncbi:hypothetical protein KIH87_16420 [Paraneptunicella aestuarii]|uniref:DUF6445 family protein n=1 Tax=Paraneptunicella aestuarii TaxID=2831148 RepID=UPI001E4554F6|nr:DUF6445 family protein [Paraneptunicella aestuarii]UAA38254.1 hypothetical protein KIH87_16420 [Paraneptunicella aestuarii]